MDKKLYSKELDSLKKTFILNIFIIILLFCFYEFQSYKEQEERLYQENSTLALLMKTQKEILLSKLTAAKNSPNLDSFYKANPEVLAFISSKNSFKEQINPNKEMTSVDIDYELLARNLDKTILLSLEESASKNYLIFGAKKEDGYFFFLLDAKSYFKTLLEQKEFSHNLFILSPNATILASKDEAIKSFYELFSRAVDLDKSDDIRLIQSKKGLFYYIFVSRVDGFDGYLVSLKEFSLTLIKHLCALFGLLSLMVFLFLKYYFTLNLSLLSPLKNIQNLFGKTNSSNLKDGLEIISSNISSLMQRNRKLNKTLLKLNDELELLLENSSLMVLFVDGATGQIIKANNKATEFYGYETLENRTIFDLDDEDFLSYSSQQLSKSFTKSDYYLSVHKKCCGQKVKLRVAKKYIKVENIWIYALLDVSDFYDFFEKTAKNRRNYDEGAVVVMRYDLDRNKILDLTRNVKELWGYEKEQLIGSDFFELIERGEQKKVLNELDNSKKIFLDKDAELVFTQNYKIAHANKIYHDYLVVCKFFWIDEKKFDLVFYFQDVTKFVSEINTLNLELKRYQNILEASSIGSWQWDVRQKSIKLSGSFSRIRGYKEGYIEDNIAVERFFSLIHRDDLVKFKDELQLYIYGKIQKMAVEFRVVRSDGSYCWVSFRSDTFKKDLFQRIVLFFGTIEDVDELKQSELRLKAIASVFENSHEGIAIVDENGAITSINSSFEKITGYSKDELIGQSSYHFVFDDNENIIEFFKRSIAKNGFWQGEIWARRKDESIYPIMITVSAVKEEQKLLHYVMMFLEITTFKEKESYLEQIAHYDLLTRLPNRLYFEKIAEDAIKKTERLKVSFVLLFIDFDGFKQINDNFGHKSGDYFLTQISKRLSKLFLNDDVIARIGGDEFGAIIFGDGDKIKEMLEQILKTAASKVEFKNEILSATASIGVTLYPQKGDVDFETLLKQADDAMYLAKSNGKNKFCIYNLT